jgi:1,4-alpha-glucan branching enzyme
MNAPVFDDPELEKYRSTIIHRHKKSESKFSEIIRNSGSLSEFSNGYLYYGLHAYPDKWILREWAPNAAKIFLIGDFNHWQKEDTDAFRRIQNGNWEIELPVNTLSHGMLYKLWIEWKDGGGERIPAYCRRAVQDPVSKIFSAQVWRPSQKYIWKHKQPKQPKNPLIYEAHIGMSGEKKEVSTYNHFSKKILPHIVKMGYTAIQLMAIQEHPYYGSFGYQVSNFFAPSSRFGTPEE